MSQLLGFGELPSLEPQGYRAYSRDPERSYLRGVNFQQGRSFGLSGFSIQRPSAVWSRQSQTLRFCR
jgi:hypothetical protein